MLVGVKPMYVLMVVPSDFPNGDAGAVRDMSYAKIFQDLGYSVKLIGAGKNNKEGYYNNVHYYSLFKPANNLLEHAIRFFCSKRRYLKQIHSIIKTNGLPSVIFINDISHGAIEELRVFATRNNIPIIHDSTEWYSPCEFSFGKADKSYILKNRLNTKVIKDPIKVIGISSYLTNHFRGRGLKSVRIPVIMDVLNTQISSNTDDKVKMIYAGSPGKKDYLKEIILGTAQLPAKNANKIELHILGADEYQIKELTGLDCIPSFIKIYGRVPREQVEKIMLKMDFSVLLRPPDERYSKAGFPTKVVEAMSHGVAMICNITSDLDMYLSDGDNAIIVKGCDIDSFTESLVKVTSLNRFQINSIKNNARELAEKQFDYRLWIDEVKSLIDF